MRYVFPFLLTNLLAILPFPRPRSKKKMSQSSSFYSPPEKPPRLYLPLSLSEWDLRARSNGQKQGKLGGGNIINNSRTSWRSSSVTIFGMRKNWNNQNIIDDIRIGENNEEMWNNEFDGIVASSSKEQQNQLNKTKKKCKNSSNGNSGKEQKCIKTGRDDNSSITSNRSNRLKTRLLNHSQSLANMFSMNAFRSRSKSAQITKRNEWSKENWQQLMNNGNANEIEVGNEIPPLGEHLAWLRSCGIFGNE